MENRSSLEGAKTTHKKVEAEKRALEASVADAKKMLERSKAENKMTVELIKVDSAAETQKLQAKIDALNAQLQSEKSAWGERSQSELGQLRSSLTEAHARERRALESKLREAEQKSEVCSIKQCMVSVGSTPFRLNHFSNSFCILDVLFL